MTNYNEYMEKTQGATCPFCGCKDIFVDDYLDTEQPERISGPLCCGGCDKRWIATWTISRIYAPEAFKD